MYLRYLLDIQSVKKNPKRFESLVIRAMRIGFNAKEGQYETLGKTCHY